MIKTKFFIFIFTFVFFELFAQDSTHVSDFLKDQFRVYPFEQSLRQDFSDIYLYYPYLQTDDLKIIPNDKYDTTYFTQSSFRYKRYNYSTSYYDNGNSVEFSDNIVPSLDTLPDGKYVQYYAPQPYNDGDTIKFIRAKIASVFYLQNNMLNGPCYRFSYLDGIRKLEGNYKDGTREGKWLYQNVYLDYGDKKWYHSRKRKLEIKSIDNFEMSCNYRKGLIEGPFIKTSTYIKKGKDTFKIEEITNYVNGLEGGEYRYLVNKIPMATGGYKEGNKTGDWHLYDWKDKSKTELLYSLENRFLIEHYTINEEKKHGKSVIIRHQSFGGIVDGVFISNTGQYYYERPEPLLMRNNYDDFFSIDLPKGDDYSEQHNRQKYIDSLGYVFKFSHYERYYPNGQLYTKFNLTNGTLDKESDLFWENGKLKNSITYDSIKNQYIENEYDETGKLKESTLYDSLAIIVKILFPVNEITIDKIVYKKSYGDLYYFHNIDSIIPLREDDSTYLISDYIELSQKGSNEKNTYHPKTRTSTHFEKIRNTSATLTTLCEFDSTFLIVNLKETLAFKNLVISYEGKDSIYKDYRNNAITISNQNNYSSALNYQGFLEHVNPHQITYKGKPFSGTIKLYLSPGVEKIKKRKEQLSIYLPTQQSLWTFCYKGFPAILDYVSINETSLYPLQGKELKKATNFYKVHSIDFTFKNGMIASDCQIKNKNQQILAKIPIQENKITGPVQCYAGYLKFWDHHFPRDFKETNYFLSNLEDYANGKRNGFTYEFNEKGDTILSCNYLDDQPNGTYISKQLNEIEYRYYQNGKSTGMIQTIDSAGIVLEELRYMNRQLDGKSSFYTDKGILYQTANFKQGMLVDSLITYNVDRSYKKIIIYDNNFYIKELAYNNGILHEEFISDTTKTVYSIPSPKKDEVSNKLLELYDPYQFGEKMEEGRKTGYLKCYDPDGKITKKGNIKEYYKTGLWHYHFPQPLGDYTIHYVDSSITINDTLVFPTKGEFIQKDEQGNILSKRYILSETPLYNCGQNETYDILLYYVAHEKDSSLHLKNGFIKNYYPTLVKQSEGRNENGLPTGLWKFYNDNGSLREIGYFNNGKKTGRWLSGDLSKIHYMGDICLDLDNEELSNFVEENEGKLEITETFFENGKVLIRNDFSVKK